MDASECDELMEDVARWPQTWRAGPLGQELGLVEADRQRLKIRTIAAIDMTAEERRQAARLRRRQHMRNKRRAAGAKLRADYEANRINKQKPWIAAGISRRSWYRHRTRNGAGTGP
jgi:hypothetical protein